MIITSSDRHLRYDYKDLAAVCDSITVLVIKKITPQLK